MRVFVFEPREDRRAGLIVELRGSGIEAQLINEDFFSTGLVAHSDGKIDTRAILLGEYPEMQRHIRALRQRGCANPLIVLKDFRNAQSTAELLNMGADDVIVAGEFNHPQALWSCRRQRGRWRADRLL